MAEVVAQLVEWSLPTPEIHGTNPVIGNYFLLSTVFKKNFIEKMTIKKKMPVLAQLKK